MTTGVYVRHPCFLTFSKMEITDIFQNGINRDFCGFATECGVLTFNLPDFSGARFVTSADIKNPTVYVGKVGDGNTRMGMHAGESAGNMDRLGYIIATNYSGNPAYLRGLVGASRTVDNDTNQYLLAENQLSVAPEMLVCIKY